MTEARIKQYMRMAIQAAEKARGKSSPNPFVGSVIVKNDTVLSQGWTLEYGSDHSEIQALKKAGKKARGATLFVTLEPCSHYGKTPPVPKPSLRQELKRSSLEFPTPILW